MRSEVQRPDWTTATFWYLSLLLWYRDKISETIQYRDFHPKISKHDIFYYIWKLRLTTIKMKVNRLFKLNEIFILIKKHMLSMKCI